MRPSRAIVATLAVLVVAAPASAATPTIRVETVARELVQPVTSGSVRSYVDTAGAAHVLAPRTALGQIVALAARRDVPVTVQFFASFNSGLLQRFASGQSATGGWQFTVNGVPSQVGADAAVIPSGAEVVWWLIDDFGKQGAFVPLDLDLVSKRANGDVRFRVTKFDAAAGKVVGAGGATLRVNGHNHAVSASGIVTVHVKPGTRFAARATAPSTIRSERVSGTA
jgi:Domain of unknown function (DUF4430)